jgi:hypothetical protein
VEGDRARIAKEEYYGLSKVVEDEEGGALQSCYDDFKDMMNDYAPRVAELTSIEAAAAEKKKKKGNKKKRKKPAAAATTKKKKKQQQQPPPARRRSKRPKKPAAAKAKRSWR